MPGTRTMPMHTRLFISSAHLVRAAGSIACASLLIGCAGGVGTPDPADVSGRYILSISDADMPATAIFDGRLAPRTDTNGPTLGDSVTVIGLPLVSKTDPQYLTPFAQLAGVSNSVIGPPNAVAVTRDGTRAYVVESRGAAPAGATMMSELPAGRILTAIDLTNPMTPLVLGTADVGDSPIGVDVHPSGDLVAVITAQPRQQLVLVPTTPAGLGEPLGWPLLGVDNDETVQGTSVQWHPGGEILAVTLPGRNEVAFYRVTRDADGSLGVSPWGDAVRVGRFPISGRFTPDGKHFVVAEMQWDMNNEMAMVQSTPGTLSVISVDSLLAPADRNPQHRLVGSSPVGVNPEGLAISPDGRFVATSNFQRTFMPDDDARVTREGSISFLSLSEGSGELTPIGEYPIPGMPGGLSFDAAGRYLVVTRFRSFDPNDMDGALTFFQVHTGDSPSLQRADFSVGVGKGPHGVLIIR